MIRGNIFNLIDKGTKENPSWTDWITAKICPGRIFLKKIDVDVLMEYFE